MRFLLLLIICSAATAGQRAEVKAANDIFAAGDYGKAVMKYRDITERYPDCVEAKYNLAISLLNNGESEEGENVLRELSSSSGEKLARKINSQLAYRQLAEAVKGLDDESAAGSLTPDVIKDKVQKLTDEYVKKIDTALSEKEKEVLG